jgi:ketosteroid isomerase-like protein
MRKIFLGMICLVAIAACKNEPDKTTTTQVASAATANKPPAPVEFADQRFMDMAKKTFQLFESGDIDGWLNGFADNAIYRWSAGDSLAGKDAISKYWKDRRKNVIDSIHFDKEIYLPVTVNQPQSIESKGTWVLSWHQVNAKYKNGKQLSFWVHTDMHYNKDGKIDEAIQYLDRAPINAALAKK